ncbi:hypothetical protein Droror1_Dr00026455 [Drosera rotundifolia]
MLLTFTPRAIGPCLLLPPISFLTSSASRAIAKASFATKYGGLTSPHDDESIIVSDEKGPCIHTSLAFGHQTKLWSMGSSCPSYPEHPKATCMPLARSRSRTGRQPRLGLHRKNLILEGKSRFQIFSKFTVVFSVGNSESPSLKRCLKVGNRQI